MNPEINRNNFDEHWLEYESNSDNTKFIECILIEKQGSRELIKDALKQAILEHHFPINTIKRCLEKLDFKQLAEDLPDGATMKGNFGEVIASEHLCQCYNYQMPIYKLRYRDSPMPMRGEDVVAFKIKDEIITGITIGEAKFMADFRPSEVKNAHEKLEKTYIIKPYTLSQIQFILDDKGDELSLKLASQISDIGGKLGDNEFPRENWIFIVSGEKKDEPFNNLKSIEVVENLRVFVLYLENLIEFTEEVFKISGMV